MPYGRARYHRRAKRTTRRTVRRASAVSRRSRTYSRRRSSRGFKRYGWSKATPYARKIKFIYADDGFSLFASASGHNHYSFSGNSPFDPDVSGVGVQPYGWDEHFPGLFQMYNVFASKIEIYFSASTSNSRLRLFIIPSRTLWASLTAVDPSDLTASPFTRQLCYNSIDGSRGTRLSNYMSTRRLHPDTVYKDDRFASLYNTSPANRWYWHFVLWDMDATDANILFDVRITYYCQISRNNTIDES